MQGSGGGRNPFFDFGDPFASVGGFGTFGPPRSILSNFLGGRNPFDDLFITHPFGNMFQSTPFGPTGNLSPEDMHSSGFLEQQAPEPTKSRGPIIEQLNSDDDEEDAKEEEKENPRKRGRSNNEPSVEHPDDEAEGKKVRHLQHKNEYNIFKETRPQLQAHSFCFHSSVITYGGANGTYHTSSRTRSASSDGVTFKECKEANSATGQATHTVSRGLHSKGTSLSRKLNSNGKVDTMKTLCNLNEDELAGFEEAWEGKARMYFPGWNDSIVLEASSSAQDEQARQGGWALPSTEHGHSVRRIPEVRDKVGSSSTQLQLRATTNASDKSAYHHQRHGHK